EAAAWLAAAERDALVACLRDDNAQRRMETTGGALRNRRTWLIAVIHLVIPVTLYGIGFWMPQMLKTASGAGDFAVGLVSAIPYAVGAAAMVVVGRHSDLTGERRWHFAAAAAVCAAALAASTWSSGAAWVVATLTVAMAALASMFGPFWALATADLGGVG